MTSSAAGSHPPRGRRPVSTYRLQFRAGIGFDEARGLLPYLERLGITDLYASPLLRARSGSEHGYDVVDPGRLDPALGGARGFRRLASDLRRRGMGLVLDIVPNHLAASPENPWWLDVLRRGQRSPHARAFDVDWEAPGAAGRVVLPALGESLPAALERGAFTVEVGGDDVWLRYGDLRLPLSGPSATEVVVRGVAAFNRRRTSQAGIERFERLLRAQHYVPAWWRVANTRGNVRRFFDIADLVAVREEDPVVFERRHALIRRLVERGDVTGLRVDHVDGLRDPLGYLRRLRAWTRVPYLVIEKILEGDERLPRTWPVDGTTGYEFLNDLGDLFVAPAGWRRLRRMGTHAQRPLPGSFRRVARAARREVLDELFRADVLRASALIGRLAAESGLAVRALRDLPEVVAATAAAFPVYRTYVGPDGPSPADRRTIVSAMREASETLPESARPALRFLQRVLLLQRVPEGSREAWLDAVARWQQLTGPVAAKGVEDTALYRDVRMLARNEVGGDPGRPPRSVEDFHRRNGERRRRWPGTMLATSTHDTKRSEDVRARLAVLSEIPDEWTTTLRRWRRANASLRDRVDGSPVPVPEEEDYLYQTLVGAWPLDPGRRGFLRRIREHVVKAAREAKVHTSWLDPKTAHERALGGFVGRILDPGNERFLAELDRLARRVAEHGAWNSLGQVVLKVASPGVPDLYRGCETWCLDLVDPDNRRPVDFARLDRRLAELDRRAATDPEALATDLLASWPDGRIKLLVTSRTLRLRRDHSEVFLDGAYLSLRATGRARGHLVAFARRRRRTWVLAIASRLTTRLTEPGRPPIGDVWDGTRLSLPDRAPARWRDAISGREVVAGNGRIELRDALAVLPATILVAQP